MDSSYHRIETPTVSQQETFLTSLFVSAHLSLEITRASCVHVQVFIQQTCSCTHQVPDMILGACRCHGE